MLLDHALYHKVACKCSEYEIPNLNLLLNLQQQQIQIQIQKPAPIVCNEDCIVCLQKDVRLIYDKYISKPKELKDLTAAEQADYDAATTCHICKKEFTNESDYKVPDHCHVLGNFLGAPH